MAKKFIMSEDALENYGSEWRGVILEATHTATKYMPASEFFAKGEPEGYHPGYDESSKCALYDLKRADNGVELPFSLYAWELKKV
jgi:hypothetical protein